MSLVYCRECDKNIDTDFDEHYVHFSDRMKEVKIPTIILDMKNLGKGEHKRFFDLYQKGVDKFEKNIKEVIIKQMKGGLKNGKNN